MANLVQKLAAGLWIASLMGGAALSAAEFGIEQQAFFNKHCSECHDALAKEGGLDLAALSRDLNDAETLRRWVRIYDRLAGDEMPPKEAPQPQAEAKRALLASLGPRLADADRAQREVVYRRLNRNEYENTIRELFGVRAEVAAMLPEDAKAHGFDNIGEALAASTELIEAYLRAADVAIDMVLRQEQPPRIKVRSTFDDGFKNRANAKQVFRFLDEGVVHYLSDLKSTHVRNFAAPASGTYRIRFRARAYRSTEPIKVEVGAGDVHKGNHGRHIVGYFDVQPETTEIVFEDWLRAGDGFSVRPFGIGNVRIGQNRNYAGPGLLFADYDVEGPIDDDLAAGKSELLGKIHWKTATAADARQIISRFLPRAFRRPVFAEEIDRYAGLVDRLIDGGDPIELALRAGLRAVLCAPEFLFLNERPATSGETIDDYAIASRLSYFLWSTMPDDELLELASRNELRKASVRRQQVERLLASSKATAFTTNFTGQWLKLRQLAENEPDQMLYPEYDALLEYSMGEETRRFFDEVVRQNLTLMDFVDSDWAILNDRLAKHYGVPGISGAHFRRVALQPDSVRGGLLTQASILKVTANGTTTSPVIRGAWAIENLLGIHVPPPPPVPAVEPDLTGATTLRQQLEKHRNDVSCASCHSKIDPSGFALESFDAIGGWRESYRIPLTDAPALDPKTKDRWPVTYKQGLRVDSTGKLPTGEGFDDIREFKALLRRDPDRIALCLTEKLLTYGLGRGLGFSDRSTVEAIVAGVREKNYAFRALLQEIAASDAFIQP
jgi:mono/diheme cytochrome c family protein